MPERRDEYLRAGMLVGAQASGEAASTALHTAALCEAPCGLALHLSGSLESEGGVEPEAEASRASLRRSQV